MHSSSPTVFVLCMVAQGAGAQCIDAAAAPSRSAVAELKSPSITATSSQGGARQEPELIKAAAAGTRDGAPPSSGAVAKQAGQDKHPRRGGTAMLLAALALMSGIALRRYGAPGP